MRFVDNYWDITPILATKKLNTISVIDQALEFNREVGFIPAPDIKVGFYYGFWNNKNVITRVVRVSEINDRGYLAVDSLGNSNLYLKGWLIPCHTNDFTLIKALSEKEWAVVPMICPINYKEVKNFTCADYRERFVKKVSKSDSHRGVLGLSNLTFSQAMRRLSKSKLLLNVKSFLFKVLTNSLPTNSHGFGPSKTCLWCVVDIGDYDHYLDDCPLAKKVKNLYNNAFAGKFKYTINLNKRWDHLSKRDISLSIRWIVYWNIWKLALSYSPTLNVEPMEDSTVLGNLAGDLLHHREAFKWSRIQG